MKKLFFAAILAVTSLSLSAQRASDSGEFSFWDTDKPEAKFEWGIRAGLNVSTLSFSWDEPDKKSKVGFNAGVALNFPINNSFYINSGLFYTTKGVKFSGENGRSYFKETCNMGYVELPIYASYRLNFAEASQLQVNFGPYLAVGVNGKDKYESDYGYDEAEVFNSDEGGFKRFDCGLGVGVGYTFHKVYLGLNYQFGLLNIVKDADENESVKTRNFSISVGYNF